ncbi:hypothetical protein BHM03_00032701 [Ensete ventricosum]|nr:hypothetical protein BHM03_00032701 [Ensete ventricosum]
MDTRTAQTLKGDSMIEVSVDWRGKPCRPNKHGGMRAAAFVLGLSLSLSPPCELGIHGKPLVAKLVGVCTVDREDEIVFTLVQGFILLSVQAHLPQLRPPPCNMISEEEHCTEATGFKATVFFLALYLVAVGSGCLKPNMISHGADQFRNHDPDPDQSRKLSTYFNAAYFSFCAGELVALTLLVWVQTRSGMDVGFGVSAGAMAVVLAILVSGAFFYRNRPPHGSIFMPLARVFVAAFTKRKQVCPSIDPRVLQRSHFNSPHHLDVDDGGLRHATMFRFLDKACVRAQEGGWTNAKESPWRLCTAAEVEQAKVILSVIPIFACTIIFNTVLAQLQTLSVQQGNAMNTQLTSSFHVPPASLQSIPYIVLLVLVPIYETTFVPLARKLTGNSSGITPLQRIGVGLFTVALSMVSAAVVEKKRRETAVDSDELLSIFWIAPQFLIFGLSEMFTAVGLIEFFYKQSVAGIQSFLTAMTYCSYSFGFYLSSLLVSMVNKITSLSSTRGWLSDNDLNKDRLDLFYWLLAALSLLNFFNYLYWCRWYAKGQPASMNPSPPPPGHCGEDDGQHSFCSSNKHVGAEGIL